MVSISLNRVVTSSYRESRILNLLKTNDKVILIYKMKIRYKMLKEEMH